MKTSWLSFWLGLITGAGLMTFFLRPAEAQKKTGAEIMGMTDREAATFVRALPVCPAVVRVRVTPEDRSEKTQPGKARVYTFCIDPKP